MLRRNLTEKQKRHRDEFSSGFVGQKFRQAVHATQFEQLLNRLNLSEDNCHLNAECAVWCRSNRDRHYIPEIVLHRLRTKCIYDDSVAPYSLVAGIVIPEPPAAQQEVDDEQPLEQAA
jgi:hypothetical protein